MSAILLDTHVFLWLDTNPGRIGSSLALLESPDTDVLLSAASSWEIAIKYALGKLKLPQPPQEYVIESASVSDVTLIDISHGDALAMAGLPPLHRDPFDRLLLAQAQRGGYQLMTADASLLPYPVDTILVGP